jgi:hypothetical protein
MQGVRLFSAGFLPVLSACRRSFRLGVVLACVSVLSAGCGTLGKLEAPKEAPPTPSLEALLADASKAKLEGSVSKERETYRAAAAAYPTRKEPWGKLAESYFEVSDYGNAILAAQEVLQRDAADPVATSMLAVSGLRVSTTALAALRQQQSLRSDTRAQAEEIVKSLREVLGESVLVPSAVVPTPPPPRRVAAPRPAPAAAPAPAATPAPTAAAAPAPATSAPKPAKPVNPFERLR